MSFQQTVLSGLLTHGKTAWEDHAATLSADMFDGDLATVFQAIESLHHADRLVDTITVAEKIPEHTELIQRVAGNFSSAATLGAHIKELQIQFTENRARDIGAQLSATGDHEAAQAALEGLGDTTARAETVDSRTALKAFMEDLEAKGDSEIIGLSTGLKELDRIVGGMVAGDLDLIAGRPSMGKTVLMVNIANHVAMTTCPVGIFSLEMPTVSLMRRRVSSFGVDHGRLQRPKTLTDSDWPKITTAMQHIDKANQVYINDIGGLSINALETEARRMVKKHGCGLICVDYLQLVTCKAEKRLEVVSEVSRRLKALAKNLNVPVLALAQLNRESENRINPVPALSQLRESGQLEQDADLVIFVDRPEQRDSSDRRGEADLIVGKNRDGETGTATVAWHGKYQRFTNLAVNWTAGRMA